jgi:hypothetical protein
MRERMVVAALTAAVMTVVSSCGGTEPRDVLMLGHQGGLARLDTADGRVTRHPPGSITSPDGATVVEARHVTDSTGVEAVAVATGEELWSVTIDGTFEPRVAAIDSEWVALGPPREPPNETGYPAGRASTTIVVAAADGEVGRYELAGNIEPEAFSTDGSALFVIDYQPAPAPTQYQVRRLDLTTGELGEVFSVDAELQRSMRGTARTQVWDPDGDRLYTLYTLDDDDHGSHAFVHVLDLAEQWAHCVDLPAGFTADSSIASLAPPGRQLFVADVPSGTLAAIDTADLTVVETVELDLGRTAADSGASAMASTADRVFVGNGSNLVVVDARKLELVAVFPRPEPVIGLRPASDDDELFVLERYRVEIIDVRDGETRRRYDVGTAVVPTRPVPTIDPGLAVTECAC